MPKCGVQVGLNNHSKEIWPNFFIVGAPRAATTSLYAYLKEVPGIYLPDLKEPHYFDSKTIPKNLPFARMHIIHDRNEYLKLYENVKDEKSIGEASSTYLCDPDAPKLIHDSVPEAHIIMILRDPIERAFSHYFFLLKTQHETRLSFYDALKNDYYYESKEYGRGGSTHILYVEYGLYSEQVKRYLDIFGREQVKVIIFEEFVQNTKDTVLDILRFLGLNCDNLPYNLGKKYDNFVIPRFQFAPSIARFLSNFGNKNRMILRIWRSLPGYSVRCGTIDKILLKSPFKPKVPEDARAFLDTLYYQDVRKLERLLGQSLPWYIASKNNKK
jgi:hypothetical protein